MPSGYRVDPSHTTLRRSLRRSIALKTYLARLGWMRLLREVSREPRPRWGSSRRDFACKLSMVLSTPKYSWRNFALATRVRGLSSKLIWLLRRGASDVLVELEPTVQVGGRERVPDFRVASSDEPWTYVEVTRPDPSETQLKVREVMSALAHLIDDADGRFSLELFLRREPTSGELGELQALLPDFWNRSGPAVQELPNDLGIILLNQHPPGVLVLEEHPGEADSPRLGEMHGVAENNEPVRHLAVRLAYSDERADHFLRTEARQLSPEEPNLIMISTTNTVGGQKSWDAMIRRRLQPNIHTRVGGVALFFGGQVMTDKGLDVQMNVSLIENEHAQCPLPDRIANQLAKSQPS